MAQIEYLPHNVPSAPGAKVAIVFSKWYREYSLSMINKCQEVLRSAGFSKAELHELPGCLEIPLSVRRLLKRDPSLEAVIVFGVILKGDTYHFDVVKDLCMSGLERVSFELDTPIINEILPVDSINDVIIRAGDDNRNKGIEAGLAAAEIIAWRRKYPL